MRTDIIDSLGYGIINAERISNAVSSTGREQGYIIKVNKFIFNNFKFKNFPVDVIDLPENIGIDCLIGNDILEQFYVKINYKEKFIYLDQY